MAISKRGLHQLRVGDLCPICKTPSNPTRLIHSICFISREFYCYNLGTPCISLLHKEADLLMTTKPSTAVTNNRFGPPPKPAIKLPAPDYNGVFEIDGPVNKKTPPYGIKHHIPKDIPPFPHKCPMCGQRCYIGLSNIDHENSYLNGGDCHNKHNVPVPVKQWC